MKKIHIIGNGDMAQLFPKEWRYEREGKLMICNVPPFEVHNVYACGIVDFKMCKALTKEEVNLDAYQWVMGNRPKMWMDKNPSFYIKHSHHIREFYTDVPKYCGPNPAQAATNFNCGHFVTHYSARRHNPDQIHLWGFDSIMDHNMRSFTDVVLPSDRNNTNNYKLLDVWRPIWNKIFSEFKHIEFVIHHGHGNSKVKLPPNVTVEVNKKK